MPRSLPATAFRSAKELAAEICRKKIGLPVGVQIIGPQYGDRTCIQMARLLEREYQGFVPPPNYA